MAGGAILNAPSCDTFRRPTLVGAGSLRLSDPFELALAAQIGLKRGKHRRAAYGDNEGVSSDRVARRLPKEPRL